MAFVIKFVTPQRHLRINFLYRVPLPAPPLAKQHAQLTGSRFRAPQISKVHQLCNLQLQQQRVSTKSVELCLHRWLQHRCPRRLLLFTVITKIIWFNSNYFNSPNRQVTENRLKCAFTPTTAKQLRKLEASAFAWNTNNFHAPPVELWTFNGKLMEIHYLLSMNCCTVINRLFTI